ncbi:SDR family oxidoreductase [Sphingobium sp. 3R8]|uniref:SDR family NAD(P)-dependent oxidoreductase n=1 Tax=Sphingobium sp. 3R8 TaxID=2874921 RepID=UPI001CC9CC15|nr:SDR family oxidoreductase [Sphingobium sp. 3R8]MBZ9649892.1 SDR family oxidoreductase [Sphingobium sp. 3R8]
MMGALEGKTALVTGASRGIGKAIAKRLARDGAFVLCHYRQGREGAEATVAKIVESGGKAAVLGGDVRDSSEIDKLFAEVDHILADRPLDILVNNAGVGGGGSLNEVSEAYLDDLLATNVKGTFLVTQKAVSRIPDGGRIINISSMVGLAAYPGTIAYALTKAAVNSFTRSLAADLGKRGVTVNAVAPGATDTDFIAKLLEDPELTRYYAAQAALNRIGQPDDIAAVVAFLASDDGRWVTGQVLEASGGMHI